MRPRAAQPLHSGLSTVHTAAAPTAVHNKYPFKFPRELTSFPHKGYCGERALRTDPETPGWMDEPMSLSPAILVISNEGLIVCRRGAKRN